MCVATPPYCSVVERVPFPPFFATATPPVDSLEIPKKRKGTGGEGSNREGARTELFPRFDGPAANASAGGKIHCCVSNNDSPSMFWD